MQLLIKGRLEGRRSNGHAPFDEIYGLEGRNLPEEKVDKQWFVQLIGHHQHLTGKIY
jgi:hypothetical protein